MSTVTVSRRNSSTGAVFVPKAKVAAGMKKPKTMYNAFRCGLRLLPLLV